MILDYLTLLYPQLVSVIVFTLYNVTVVVTYEQVFLANKERLIKKQTYETFIKQIS